MFVKKSWNTKAKKRHYQYHIAESYRDKETGQTRHKLLMNITKLPDHVIKAIDESLKKGEKVTSEDVKLETGDTLRGAGILSFYRAWRHASMDKVLGDLTQAQRQSVLAMTAGRVFEPGSKLALKRQLKDSLLARVFSKNRLDEDELYGVMDKLEDNFYSVQKNLTEEDPEPTLFLYDTTSTYFEGTEAEEGEYGYSKDKRWDRHQIVVGLVTDQQGLPKALEIWKGNTADRSTVSEQVRGLDERFDLNRAVFIGDKGTYSQAGIEEMLDSGLDYLLGTEWHTQKEKLEELTPTQRSLFDKQGVVQWTEENEEGRRIRYVGCVSEGGKKRAKNRRVAKMSEVEEQLDRLKRTASSGRYYSWTRLREKVNGILKEAGVKDLYEVEIEPLEEEEVDSPDPEEKTKLKLTYQRDEEAIEKRESTEGKYLLETTLSEEDYSPEELEGLYKSLSQVENAFKNIKSFLKIRPVYHYKKRRVRAHVLICFLGYYLVKKMELELREEGFEGEVIPLLRDWDKLRLVEYTLKVSNHQRKGWQWSLGDVGQEIKEQIQDAGWWRSVSAYRRSLINSMED